MAFDEIEFVKIEYIEFRKKWCPNLIHWGRVTRICVSKLSIIGSNNGLSAGRRQTWKKLQWYFNRNLYNFIQENAFDIVVRKLAAILSRDMDLLKQHPILRTVSSSPSGRIRRHCADIFNCIFMNKKFCISIRISLKFIPRVQ